jgi:hypothetical protein
MPERGLTMSDAEQGSVHDRESYEPPELTVVGAFGEVAKGSYSKPNSDDSDAGGYWAP